MVLTKIGCDTNAYFLIILYFGSLCNVCQLYDCCLGNGEACGRLRLVWDVAGARLMSSTALLPVWAAPRALLTRFCSIIQRITDVLCFDRNYCLYVE